MGAEDKGEEKQSLNHPQFPSPAQTDRAKYDSKTGMKTKLTAGSQTVCFSLQVFILVRYIRLIPQMSPIHLPLLKEITSVKLIIDLKRHEKIKT